MAPARVDTSKSTEIKYLRLRNEMRMGSGRGKWRDLGGDGGAIEACCCITAQEIGCREEGNVGWSRSWEMRFCRRRSFGTQ